ncbi:MAG TPA: stage V sporulation protein D [Bacillales bacterium]|nr:stage V sporulation protein D [Bacillales bacterium]
MRVSNVTVRKRLVIIFLAGLVVFASFIGRLAYVQFFQGDWLYEKARDSWSRNIPYQGERGKIVDRRGIVLADNRSAPSVVIVPKQVKNPAEEARKLASVLNMREKKVYEKLTKKASTVELRPEGKKISDKKADQISEMRLPGVYIAEDYRRNYPFGRFLSHVLGFAGIDNQGLVGLEKQYDDLLKGTKGFLAFYSDARGERMPFLSDEYTPPKSGMNLQLTINAKIQAILERELNDAEVKYDPDQAMAIAVNPNTGEILGMASRPNFNPEHYQDVPTEVYNRNLPIWSTYEPGSTFKIITLSAALNEGLVNLKKDNFHDPGYIEVAGTKLHCWKRGGHGSETFLEVVQNSCNPGFVALGEKLGKKKLFSYIHAFGFGKKTGIDLQGEGKGILFKPENIGPLELATTAFGQGVSVTPIQQVMAVSAAINGGFLYEPYIAKGWIDPVTGTVIARQAPTMKRRVISGETSKKVRHALESVVAKGTGRAAYHEGWRIGGKTGTAQKAKNGRYLENNYILSFIGFAPADDPQIVVYLAIDNAKDAPQFGGQVAAPIAGDIIADSLRVMGVPKRKNGLEKERKWNDPRIVKVPDLVGLSKKDIRSSLFSGLKIEAEGNGKVVIAQSPQAGAKLEEGSTIRIYLGDKIEKED